MRKAFFCLYMIAIISFVHFHIPGVASATNDEKPSVIQENESWTIGYGQGLRNSNYTDCDATDSLIYFAYDDGNLIDAYDYDGVYQFTIFFRDYRNGGMSIRCYDGLLYVKTKLDTVFIFNGDQEVNRMPYSDAQDLGWDFYWFQETHIYADRQNIYSLGVDGSWIPLVKTPDALKHSIPFIRFTPEIDRIITIIGLLVLFIFGFIVIFHHHHTRTKENRGPFRLG